MDKHTQRRERKSGSNATGEMDEGENRKRKRDGEQKGRRHRRCASGLKSR